MLDLLLPRRADDGYGGHRLALWLFGLVLLVRIAMSFGTMLRGREVAVTADGIPLDTFGPAGAQAVVSLLALLGLAQLVIALAGVVVLARYRALVPLALVLLVVEYVGRRIVLRVLPIPRTGAPPGGVVNLALLAVMIVALVLSVWRPEARSPGVRL